MAVSDRLTKVEVNIIRHSCDVRTFELYYWLEP